MGIPKKTLPPSGCNLGSAARCPPKKRAARPAPSEDVPEWESEKGGTGEGDNRIFDPLEPVSAHFLSVDKSDFDSPAGNPDRRPPFSHSPILPFPNGVRNVAGP
jgi:hypothetical protein